MAYSATQGDPAVLQAQKSCSMAFRQDTDELGVFAWQVHARNKSVDPTINWEEVARSMSGFTGVHPCYCSGYNVDDIILILIIYLIISILY